MKEKGGRLFFGQHFQYSFEIADGAAGDGLRVGAEIEDLHGNIAFITVFEQCFQDRREFRLAKAGARSIGVIDMDMAEIPGIQSPENGSGQ